jgi:hypothetical protein
MRIHLPLPTALAIVTGLVSIVFLLLDIRGLIATGTVGFLFGLAFFLHIKNARAGWGMREIYPDDKSRALLLTIECVGVGLGGFVLLR